MASQYRRVTGAPRLRTGEAALQAKIAMLPQMMQRKQQQQLIARDTKFQNQQIAMAKQAAKQKKRAEAAAMGLEAGKLGLTMATGSASNTTAGDIVRGTKNIFGGNKEVAPEGGDTGWKSYKPGSTIASGLTGYGLGKMMGGKSKKKKALYGAIGGGITGLLSGKDLISGGIGAGVGALASGLFA